MEFAISQGESFINPLGVGVFRSDRFVPLILLVTPLSGASLGPGAPVRISKRYREERNGRQLRGNLPVGVTL